METLPLTNPQRRIWFAEMENPGTNINNLAFVLRFDGATLEELERAWNTVLEKADAFRIHILERPALGDDFPISQVVTDYQAHSLELHSFHSQELADQWMKAQAGRPFQLFDSPLFSIAAIQVNDGCPNFFLCVHHIISDGASISLLKATMKKLLRGESVSESCYVDFLTYENTYKSSDKYKEDRAYWLQQAVGYPEPIDLGSGNGEGRPIFKIFTVRPEVAQKCHAFAAANRVSLYKQVAVASEVALARITRTKNFVLGMANHNRSKPELFTVFGMFVSTLPLMLNFEGSTPYSQRCKELSAQINTAIKKHSQFPFEDIVKACHTELDFDLASVMHFNLVGHPGSTGEVEVVAPGNAPGGLNIHVNILGTAGPGAFTIGFAADGEVFKESDVEQLFCCLETILEAGAEEPDRCCGDLPLLTDVSVEKILAFNGPFVPYPYQSIPRQFARIVEAHPQKVAVIAGEAQLTFKELDVWSDQVAAALSEQMGKFVGVCCRRDASMLAAIFGVLKAGAAYIPMDPTYPRDRLKYMSEDAGMDLVLVHPEYEAILPENVRTLNLDTIARTGPRLRPLEVAPEDRAYAIYTSGTTGKPKGVPIEHHQLSHLCQALAKPFQISEESVCLLFASLNFDASVAEIFIPLLKGATLVVATQEDREDGERILRLLDQHKISWATLPPALLAVLPSLPLAHLESLVVAGEATDPHVIGRWSPGRRMINAYGPTECTVAVSAAAFGESSSRDIGPPIENIHCYVLDEAQQLVPEGMSGELYVAGPSISEGYIGRPELTSKRFLPNPFARPELKNPTMYKTGDLVRWLPNGHMEFIGRVDFQVKIRGHRIECGEVSNAVSSLPGVKGCTVIPLPSGATHRLVAYLLAEEELDTHELRAEVVKLLPEYMVPSAFVVLDEFPMTPNGKIDRRALPIPMEKKREYRAPEDELQRLLCGVWESLVPSSPVGIEDDFFDLGGDSLSCMKMVAEVKSKGYPLEVAMVKNNPTILGLSNMLKDVVAAPVLPPLVGVEGEEAFTLSQNSLMMTRQTECMDETGAVEGDLLSIWSFQGEVDIERVESALDRLALSHDIFRLSLKGDVLSPESAPKHKLELLEDFQSELERWVEEEASGPRCRFRFVQTGPGSFKLALRATHELLDGWSGKLVEQRLMKAIKGESLDEGYQFRDFCAWYKRLIQEGHLDEQEQYWQRLLSNFEPVFKQGLEPDLSAQPYKVVNSVVPLKKDLRDAFEDECREAQCTLFEGAYALFNMLVARRTHQSSVLTGYVSAMRGTTELQGIVGSLTNRLYLGVNISEKDDFGSAVKQVQNGLAENQKNSLYPAWRLRESDGIGFPGVFFHYVPRHEAPSSRPGKKGARIVSSPPPQPTFWPLGLAFQLVDHPERPMLLTLARAGFTSVGAIRELMEDYCKLMTEVTESAQKGARRVGTTRA